MKDQVAQVKEKEKGTGKGTGGRSASFLVGISSKTGLVMCTQYFRKLNEEGFAKIMIYLLFSLFFTLTFNNFYKIQNELTSAYQKHK